MSSNQSLPGLIKLSGIISNYRCTRSSASFVFTDGDRTSLGVIAIAAGITGLSGQAVATATNATSIEEDADYVEFNLDDKSIKGWVWRSPFKDGDSVEVAAEWKGEHHEAAGIARPSDHVIGLYPHCSRGTITHAATAAKWWLIGSTALNIVNLVIGLFVVRFSLTRLLEGFPYVALAFYAFFGLAAFSLARKWMPFVRLAEKVFTTLGLPDPGNIDLVKSSKAQRKPDDPGEFGTFYFRY